jgi:hypothetical protein
MFVTTTTTLVALENFEIFQGYAILEEVWVVNVWGTARYHISEETIALVQRP